MSSPANRRLDPTPPSSSKLPGRAANSRLAVPLFAVLITVLIFVLCFFYPRSPGMEEVVVYNAVYTYAHYGQMAFPVYGPDFAHSFGIHPHLHYAILGLLVRA